MFHQWWNIDTYSHILLVPPIIGWLIWIKRDDLIRTAPQPWIPALAWLALGLLVWMLGRGYDINLIAQLGTIVIFQGATGALLGARVILLLLFPLVYAFFLVPFGDEIIPPLQSVTAELATRLTVWSGIEIVANGINIDTPAGLFIVAEECSGVKFLVAMVALGMLVAYTCFSSWIRRILFLLACVIVPVLANGVRAWATIFLAQYVGAEAAGSFDHVVYGWFFFGIVIALILGVGWHWFERDPEEAGWTAETLQRSAILRATMQYTAQPNYVMALIALLAAAFATIALVV